MLSFLHRPKKKQKSLAGPFLFTHNALHSKHTQLVWQVKLKQCLVLTECFSYGYPKSNVRAFFYPLLQNMCSKAPRLRSEVTRTFEYGFQRAEKFLRRGMSFFLVRFLWTSKENERSVRDWSKLPCSAKNPKRWIKGYCFIIALFSSPLFLYSSRNIFLPFEKKTYLCTLLGQNGFR